jgi:1-acyl-sn-glycerol-3-phosphate acyltransferase
VAEPGSGLLGALGELAGALVPMSVRDLQREIDDRLAKIPNNLNEYGFDRFGMEPEAIGRMFLPIALLYRKYFRVETDGIGQVPGGRVLLIANHAGQLPFDAAMLGASILLEAEPPRIARGMGEYWIPQLPFVSVAASRAGHLVGTPENCTALLEAGECVIVFPEGVRGMNKTFDQRYQLQRFGLGFIRLALETGTPIVPVGIVGSEEQQPGLANLERLGSMLSMPALPITPTFPLLGPLGLLPLPVKYRILFGEPLRLEGTGHEEDAVIQEHVSVVRHAIGALLTRGRQERAGIFT